MEYRAVHHGPLAAGIHVNALGAGDTGLTHSACHHRRMRGLAAAAGQDALGGKEAVDIFRFGLFPHQDHFFAGLALDFRAIGVEHDAPEGGAGRRRQPLGQKPRRGVGIQAGVKELVQVLGVDPEQRLFLADQSFLLHLHRGAHHGAGVHLAVTRLQAVQRAPLDGELEILDFAVVRLQLAPQLLQLAVQLRRFFGHGLDGFGRTNAGNHVLPLGVRQIFAVKLVFPGGGIAGERDAGGAVVPHVAEHHHHHVDGGAVGDIRSDMKFPPVVDGALAHPGAEHRLDRDRQLFVDIFRKRLSCVILDHRKEHFADLRQVGGA